MEPSLSHRSREIARELLALGGRSGFTLDIQKVFSWLPPDRPAGQSLFRLVEALPRTPDRANRVELLRELSPIPGAAVAAPLLPEPAALAINLVSRQFVYAENIGEAIKKGAHCLAGSQRHRFSFDMLGEGARTLADADAGMARYQAAISAARNARRRTTSNDVGVSVKLSSIHPRFDAAGWPLHGSEIAERLRALCQMAAAGDIQLAIDAEESERLELQLDLFRTMALDTALLRWGGLGLAVQAYLQESQKTIAHIISTAETRRAKGGAQLTVRLVKGAYWDAEVKRAQEQGLDDYPVFTDKTATDLSYIACATRMLDATDAIYPQFATHNPLTLGVVLAKAEARLGAQGFAKFEVQRLHGMGESLDAALGKRYPALGVRIYAPVGSSRELLPYLVRRLLENGATTSYVRQAAQEENVDRLVSKGFERLDHNPARHTLSLPRELHMPERPTAKGYDLGRVSVLTEFASKIEAARKPWRAAPIVNGKVVFGTPSPVHSPATKAAIGEAVDATPEDVRTAIAAAHAARGSWDRTPVADRAAKLERLADLMEKDTAQLMALCVWEAGKTIGDALADVREAIDFCRYYADQARRTLEPRPLISPAGETNVLSLHGRGVFACISPWNFPVAIFTGQIVAALVAGNTVVAKPAEQTPLTAFRIAELILEAGVPAGVFHLLPGQGETIGKAIVEDIRVCGVVFTGSNETAHLIQRALSMRDGPIVPFVAETGGMNAMIVDSTALPEQAVDAIVSSAFKSAGQRCSSLRMLYVQNEVAPALIEMLKGAMAELQVGDPSEPSTDIGPVIDEDARKMLTGYVEQMRSRARVIAECAASHAPGSFILPIAFEVGSIHDLPGERFGPILHIARFASDDLRRVIDEINSTGYGLTIGIHTRLDERAEWMREHAAVGNIYVNRNMIGATVGIQPFGGEGLSGTGPKAGGPLYLLRFVTERVFTVNTAAAGGDISLMTKAA